jgi:hypothetical protein
MLGQRSGVAASAAQSSTAGCLRNLRHPLRQYQGPKDRSQRGRARQIVERGNGAVANPAYLELLKQGEEVWNESNRFGADLSGADLSEWRLFKYDLSGADLSGANLTKANLWSSNLSHANLSGARLSGAQLDESSFFQANLSGANLNEVYATSANLSSGHCHVWTSPADQGLFFDFARVAGAVMSSASCAEKGLRRP